MQIRDVYVLSGLGADNRVFQRLDLSGCQLHFLPWKAPLRNESLTAYAERMAMELPDTAYGILGLSFGGMLAAEIVRTRPGLRCVLISSVPDPSQLPWYYRAAGRIKLYRFVPVGRMKRGNRLTCWFFGTETKEDRELLKSVLRDTDRDFLKWAVTAVLSWKTNGSVPDVFRIHGTRDRILPAKQVQYTIPGGGHFMVFNRSGELTAILDHLFSQ